MFIAVKAMENIAVSWITKHGTWSQVILKRRKDLHTTALFRWVLGWAGLLITFLCNSLPRTMFRNYCYILMKTEWINCYWLINRRSLRKQNTRQLKISGKLFSKRVLAIFIILQFPFCNNARTKRFPFCLYSVFWVLTLVLWQRFFWKRTLSVSILITRKQALFTLNNDRWQNGKKKVHLSVYYSGLLLGCFSRAKKNN